MFVKKIVVVILHKFHAFGLLKSPMEFEFPAWYYIGTKGSKPHLPFLHASSMPMYSQI